MSGPLSNAPVYYALAQARFNPVAAMDEYANKIQDRLRRIGYTVLEMEEMQGFEFNLEGHFSSSHMKPKTAKLWYFTKEDRSCGFVLGTEFLTFQSTKYVDHEEFFASLLVGLGVVHEVVHLDSIVRLGIRYLNAILPKNGESVDSYLADSVHGVAIEGATRNFAASESVFSTTVDGCTSTLIAKVFKAHAPLGFPSDLAVNSVQVLDRFKISDPISHAVIDMDNYSEQRSAPDSDALLKVLKSLHRTIAVCFHSVATPHAFERWE